MRTFVVLLCVVFSTISVVAQHSYVFEKSWHKIDTTLAEGNLLLGVVNKNFFRNDEYFGEYVEGYTLPGYSLRPTLIYQVARNVSIEAGVELLQYGGEDKYDRVVPYFVAQWQMNNSLHLTMGCIEGASRAELSEAIYDSEHQLNMLPETGLEVSYSSELLQGSIWLNWQQFIRRNDTIPEKFMFGLAVDYSPSKESALWQFKVPFRLTISHVGGQISNYPERMQSLANGSLSLRCCRRVNGSFVKSIGIDLEGLFFYTMSGEGVRPFDNGWGFYPKIKLDTRIFDFGIGYYTSRDYYALHGNPLYMSLSNYQDYYQSRRNMLTFEGNINHSIHRDVRFTLGAKGYFDTDASAVEYWYTAALVITPRWHIIKR